MTDLEQALERIWERSKPVTRERLERLEAAADALGRGRLGGAALDDAVRAAHQLAGSLGTFGLHDGTLLARAVETELTECRDPARVAELVGKLRELLEPRLAGG